MVVSLMTDWTKITLRLPEQVHAALVEVAKDQATSLNQIIVDRLNQSLGGVYVSEAEANDGAIIRRLAAIEQRLEKLENVEIATEDQSASKQGKILRDLKERLVGDQT